MMHEARAGYGVGGGYEQVVAQTDGLLPTREPVIFEPNRHYEQYLRMHKVLVGQGGAQQLQEIHESLATEFMPRYLSAAGWAAAEAALVQRSASTQERMALLRSSQDCWQRALANQQQLNRQGPEHVIEYAFPHRQAVDIAILPLLRGIVGGNVSAEACRQSFEDCLRIAQSNLVQLDIASKQGQMAAVSEHSGLGYELNALLSFNRRLSQTWFVIPATSRSDTGYYHPQQTHDLLVIHQKWGEIVDAAPVEIKASASSRDRERYKALLVRGKMHLTLEGKHRPEHTLNAIAACYEGNASAEEKYHANSISNRFMEMAQDYYAGSPLGAVATGRSFTRFRDNTRVVANHPGLAAKTAS